MRNYFVVLLALTIILAGCNDPSDSDTTGAKYSIIYYGNGNTYGFPPVDNNQYTSGSYATVLDKNTLQKDGYEFGGWNTKSDYSGTHYGSEDRIKIKNINIYLHAVWE